MPLDSSGDNKTLEEYILEAKELQNSGKSDLAVKLLREAIEKHESSLKLYAMLGRNVRYSAVAQMSIVARKLKRIAKHSVIQSDEDKENLIDIYNQLGILHQKLFNPKDLNKKQSNLHKAVDFLKEALRLGGSEATYMILSYTYQMMGNLGAAIFTLEKGLDKFELRESENLSRRKKYLEDQNELGALVSLIRKMVADDNLDGVFKTLKKSLDERFIEIYNDLLQKQSTWNDLRKEFSMNRLNYETYITERNKIVRGILEIVNRIG